jgi:hypothetical protein
MNAESGSFDGLEREDWVYIFSEAPEGWMNALCRRADWSNRILEHPKNIRVLVPGPGLMLLAPSNDGAAYAPHESPIFSALQTRKDVVSGIISRLKQVRAKFVPQPEVTGALQAMGRKECCLISHPKSMLLKGQTVPMKPYL